MFVAWAVKHWERWAAMSVMWEECSLCAGFSLLSLVEAINVNVEMLVLQFEHLARSIVWLLEGPPSGVMIDENVCAHRKGKAHIHSSMSRAEWGGP